MISFIGCEECCGYLWQWSENIGPCATSSWRINDGLGRLGQTNGRVAGLFLGGGWSNGSYSGSRCHDSNENALLSQVAQTAGGRGVSKVLCM